VELLKEAQKLGSCAIIFINALEIFVRLICWRRIHRGAGVVLASWCVIGVEYPNDMLLMCFYRYTCEPIDASCQNTTDLN